MTGAILDDTHRVCQFSLFRGAVGGGTRGKLYASYADLMTGLMIVTTYCGSLSIVFTAGGGSLRTLQYHKNLHITPCGCKLSTYKKTGRKILRILTKKSQKYTMLSAKKSNVTPFGIKITLDSQSKSRIFALYYRGVLSKKAPLSNVTPFGIKIT